MASIVLAEAFQDLGLCRSCGLGADDAVGPVATGRS
jgi:hypothetical protein